MSLRPVSRGETVSPETSFRYRETSSARLPLSPRSLLELPQAGSSQEAAGMGREKGALRAASMRAHEANAGGGAGGVGAGTSWVGGVAGDLAEGSAGAGVAHQQGGGAAGEHGDGAGAAARSVRWGGARGSRGAQSSLASFGRRNLVHCSGNTNPRPGNANPRGEESISVHKAICTDDTTLGVTQGGVLSQSPTDATRFWWHLFGS